MTQAFPPHIDALLRTYSVPALPDGFADRVLAAAQKEASAPLQPRRFWHLRPNSPWTRGRYLGSGVIGVAMLSTAAAAALSLSESPIRIPIVSDLVEQVLPAPAPSVVKTENPVSLDDDANLGGSETDLAEPALPPKRWRDMDRAEKRTVVKQAVERREERIQQRRIDRGLEPLTDAQLRQRRAALRERVRNGDIDRRTVRKAIRRDIIREQRQSGRDEAQPSEPLAGASALQSGRVSGSPSARPGVAENRPGYWRSLSANQKAQLLDRLPDDLKTQLRNAPPRERRRLLREWRQRRIDAGQTPPGPVLRDGEADSPDEMPD